MATPPMPKLTSAPNPKTQLAKAKKREAQRKKRNAARRAARAKARETAARQATKTAGKKAAARIAGRVVPVVGTAMAAGAASKKVTEDYKKMTNEKPDLSLTPGSAAFSRRMKAIQSNIASAKRANDKAAVKSLESRLKRMQAVAPKSQTKAASKPKMGGFAATKKAAPALKTSPAKKKMSFGEAFPAARRAGKKPFQFTKANGKTETFTTETREEKAAREAKAAKKESMAKKKETLKKTVERSGAESRKLADKKKRRAAGKYVGPRQRMVDRLERERREKKKTAKRKTGSSMKPKGVGVAMRGYGGAMVKKG